MLNLLLMRLLERLYELGLYVDDENEIKHFIAQHPEVIDDLAYTVEMLMQEIPQADYLLYTDTNEDRLILNVSFQSAKDYMKAIQLLPYLHPMSEYFQLELAVPILNDETD